MLVMLMVTGTALNSLADITIRVNMPDVVTFHFSSSRGAVLLNEGDNVFTADECSGELRVLRDDYDIECRNLTTGEDLKVDQYLEFSKINVNPYLVNDGNVLDVAVTDVRGVERTVSFVFDDPDAGFVAYLTDYDISAGSGYLYVYTPSRGDEVTIYLSDVSGVNGVEASDVLVFGEVGFDETVAAGVHGV